MAAIVKYRDKRNQLSWGCSRVVDRNWCQISWLSRRAARSRGTTMDELMTAVTTKVVPRTPKAIQSQRIESGPV